MIKDKKMQECEANIKGIENVKESVFLFLVFGVVLASLVPWAFMYLGMAIGVDVAYLSRSAEFFLDGKRMSEFYYDTNPPLSILIYVPNIMLGKFFGIPLYVATVLYTSLILLFSLISSFFLLKKYDDVRNDEILVLLSAFLVSSTVMTQYDFGQKDHFLSMALLPLVLLQYALTQKIQINVFAKIVILIACSILILLKPHFGLVPAALFIHRAIKQRRMSVCLDTDFVFLASAAVSYLAITFLYFEDFISVVLEDAVLYYTAYTNPDIMVLSLKMMIAPAFVILAQRFVFKDVSKVISVLAWASIICIIPYFMQGKGWSYHSFPYLVLFFSTAMVMSYHALGLIVGLFELKKGQKLFQMMGLYLFLLLWISTSSEKIKEFPTHAFYKNSEIVQQLALCEEGCSFFLFHDLINISHEASVYSGQKHASRFPVLWFVPYLEYAQSLLDRGLPPILSQDKIDAAWNKYIPLILEDFEHYNPDTLFIGHVDYTLESDVEYRNDFDFVESVVGRDENLRALWDEYEIVDILYIDRRKYIPRMPGDEKLMRFDVYRKIAD